MLSLNKMSSTLLSPFHSGAHVCKSLLSRRPISTASPSESSPSSRSTASVRTTVSKTSTSTESSSTSYQDVLEASLRDKLSNRPASTIKSYLDPTPSHLLNLMLADLLPSSCQAPSVRYFESDAGDLSRIPTQALPQDHHLAYFPPAVPGSELLADGTDTLHSPGPPFVRRLWAGGSLTFHHMKQFKLIRMRPSTCHESIKDVKVKGTEGDEKVFVHIERWYMPDRGWRSYQRSLLKRDKDSPDSRRRLNRSLTETRDLVFLREKTKEQALEDVQKECKILKSQLVPDWSATLIPTPDVLFRWSALTYNAHRIHLDPQYCREVEGHRNLLVHGPLSLTLILASLRSQLNPGDMIQKLEYRNLAPLYVNEEMKICIKLRGNKIVEKTTSNETSKTPDKNISPVVDEQRIYDVWIEGPKGGLAVKGKAKVGKQVDMVEYNEERAGLKAVHRKETQEGQGLAEQRKTQEAQKTDGAVKDKQPEALLQNQNPWFSKPNPLR